MTEKNKCWVYGAISEVSFFVFLYYVQMLLNVSGNLWLSTIILFILGNISLALCPFRGCCKCCNSCGSKKGCE